MNCEDCGHAIRHHPHPCEPDRPGEGQCIVCDCRKYIAPKVATR